MKGNIVEIKPIMLQLINSSICWHRSWRSSHSYLHFLWVACLSWCHQNRRRGYFLEVVSIFTN